MSNVEEGRSSVTGPSPYIHLRVKGQNGNEEYFKMKRGSQLRKLMTAYCERQSLQFDATVFLFDGRLLRPEQTPDELKMEDGDEIDAMLHQTGGVVGAS
ncbi:small ubiquitin-related modifier 1-like [Olea europaea var. sylvestris]|uniref:small ubiquitin-related modifier 1-like n=1 Tax=Olea europaea var. sylvestris TaxID=158386 RepID=UPI000C1D43B0|nr:small ubiquitin-related modifier 1-like [Olea europaea var. sylvestris]